MPTIPTGVISGVGRAQTSRRTNRRKQGAITGALDSIDAGKLNRAFPPPKENKAFIPGTPGRKRQGFVTPPSDPMQPTPRPKTAAPPIQATPRPVVNNSLLRGIRRF